MTSSPRSAWAPRVPCLLALCLALAGPAWAQVLPPAARASAAIAWGSGAPAGPGAAARVDVSRPPATAWAADALKTQTGASMAQALEDAQQQQRERRLPFAIAGTDALKFPTANLRAAALAWQQAPQVNAAAATAVRDEAAALARLPGGSPLSEGLAKGLPQRPRSATAAHFDWREFKIVGPVLNQAGCGSCWAFAAAAAFQSSHQMRNNGPVDVSEQEILDCAAGSCNGGWSSDVFSRALPAGAGLVLEKDYAGYSAAKSTQCMRRAGAPVLHAVAWGFVSAARPVPTTAELKQALVEHGPLAVGVFAGNLFKAYRPKPGAKGAEEVFTYGLGMGDSFAQSYPDDKGEIRKTWFKVDKNGDLRGTDKGELLSDVDAMVKTWLAVDHMVLLVGWDDQRRAWLIKNSWGPGWGLNNSWDDFGFGWVAYGQGNLGAYATWVRAAIGPLARALGETVQSQSTVTPAPRGPLPVVAPSPGLPAAPTTVPPVAPSPTRKW